MFGGLIIPLSLSPVTLALNAPVLVIGLGALERSPLGLPSRSFTCHPNFRKRKVRLQYGIRVDKKLPSGTSFFIRKFCRPLISFLLTVPR